MKLSSYGRGYVGISLVLTCMVLSPPISYLRPHFIPSLVLVCCQDAFPVYSIIDSSLTQEWDGILLSFLQPRVNFFSLSFACMVLDSIPRVLSFSFFLFSTPAFCCLHAAVEVRLVLRLSLVISHDLTQAGIFRFQFDELLVFLFIGISWVALSVISYLFRPRDCFMGWSGAFRMCCVQLALPLALIVFLLQLFSCSSVVFVGERSILDLQGESQFYVTGANVKLQHPQFLWTRQSQKTVIRRNDTSSARGW